MLTSARAAQGFTARKTEVSDAEGLAALRRHGLLTPSFIPPLPMCALREVTRDRESRGREQTALAKRSQQLSEGANSKLGPVASEARGVRGKARLRA